VRSHRWVAVLICLAVSLSVALTGCGGDSDPTVKIVADLPLQGAGSEQSMQMAWAIEHVIEEKYGGYAGDFKIEFESMDNSTEAAGTWDPGRCVDNAHSHASDGSIVGVIGTANSGCSEYEIPILNKAHVAMVSPADTAVGLTKSGSGTVPGQPERYYPSGKRSFFRVVASDDHQGRAGAAFMKSRGLMRVYVLDDNGLYGKGVADAFRISAKGQELKIVGRGRWDVEVRDYPALITRIKESRAEGVYVGGSLANNGRRLINAILRNTEGVKLLVSDGFVSSSIAAEGSAAEELFGTFPAAKATVSGRRLKRALERAEPDTQVEPYTVYAAAAAEVLLDAICRSNGSREDVIAKLFETDLETVVGPMRFDRNGDTKTVGKTDYVVVVYQARKGVWSRFRRRSSPPRAGRLHPVQGRKGCLRPVGPRS
jgi:branched-chain amino acid transport system substrate-binding protein